MAVMIVMLMMIAVMRGGVVDALIVLVSVMVVVMGVMVIVVVVRVIMLFGMKKIRLDLQNAFEIEGVLLQHGR
jgi:hypothetical protein